MARWLGLVSIIMMFCAAGFVLWRYEIDKTKSISQHIALYRHIFWLFAVISTVASCLFYIFMKEWFIPHFRPHAIFEYVLLAGLGCQLVAAWVPDTEKLSSQIHRIFAYTMAALMPILLALIFFASAISATGKFVAATAALLMILQFLIFRTIKSAHKFFLINQSLYIVIFYTSLLLITYS